MSNQHKLNWLVLILLLSCIWALVFVDMARGDTIHHFDTKNDSSASYVDYNGIRLQPTKQVQKTQSSARLHKLSEGTEITPIEMLRSGQF